MSNSTSKSSFLSSSYKARSSTPTTVPRRTYERQMALLDVSWLWNKTPEGGIRAPIHYDLHAWVAEENPGGALLSIAERD